MRVDTIPELATALRNWLDERNLYVWVRIWPIVSFDTAKSGATLEITAYVNRKHFSDGPTTTSDIKAVGATPQIVYDKCVEMLTADLRPREQVLSDTKALAKVF